MNMQEYIEEAEKDLLHTYNRYQVVFDHGDGVKLYDIEGKEYYTLVEANLLNTSTTQAQAQA